MSIPLEQLYIVKQIQKELRDEAELMRLADSAAPLEAGLPFYAPILARVGETLIKLGTSLQERYDDHCRTLQIGAVDDSLLSHGQPSKP